MNKKNYKLSKRNLVLPILIIAIVLLAGYSVLMTFIGASTSNQLENTKNDNNNTSQSYELLQQKFNDQNNALSDARSYNTNLKNAIMEDPAHNSQLNSDILSRCGKEPTLDMNINLQSPAITTWLSCVKVVKTTFINNYIAEYKL